MARDFDGVDDRIDFVAAAPITNLTTYTLCIWIYPRTMGEQSSGLILEHENASFGYTKRLYLLSEFALLYRFVFGQNRATTQASFTAAINTIVLNRWSFICVTYSEALGPRGYIAAPGDAIVNEVFYYNGPEIGSGATNVAEAYISMGNLPGQTQYTFDGRMANLAYFNSILSREEMATVMRGVNPRPGNCVGWFDLWGTGPELDRQSLNAAPTLVNGVARGDHPPGIVSDWPLTAKKVRLGVFIPSQLITVDNCDLGDDIAIPFPGPYSLQLFAQSSLVKTVTFTSSLR